MRDLRVIVVAPTGRDGRLICDLFARVGIQASEFRDCEAACGEARNGVGAFLVADEAFTAASVATLTAFLAHEPSWSDLPVLVLTYGGEVTALSIAGCLLYEPLGNVILIERPVRPETLVSTVRSAIRARTRQYEVRDHLRTERAAAEALRRSEKLAVVGRLAATIAHEINNPLTSVTNLHYLMASCTTLREAKRLLAIADEELARVIEITSQTLRFHRESARQAKVDVAEVVDSVLKLYGRRIASSDIVVDRSLDRSALILGYAGELRQLIANLVSNAVDSMQVGGGTLRVRLLRAAERQNGLRSGIRVVVADTGEGIPTLVRENLFEPFVTTKADTGTGLGLWVSSEIVRKHSGSLRYRSRLGSGTVFSVFLPAQPSAPASDAATPGLVA